MLQVIWDFEHSSKSLEIFTNLERFDTSWFEGIGPSPYTYVPFGGGLHMCLGNEFARA
jgi:cytochrome P450 family 26 subfamily A